jgi:LDH2 family malate/lactate/ureidoglycolate dehydrogenase
MNRPPEDFVVVHEDRLLAFTETCFKKVGLSIDHAQLISRLLVNSDLRGVRSHGVRAANGYTKAFAAAQCNPNPNIKICSESPTAVVIDGDGSLGYLSMVEATQQAISMAKEVGMGMGLVRHIGHYGSAGHYTRMCMEAGCIGFSVQGYKDHGNARGQTPKPQIGYFGNPPLCFAIPAGEEPPVILDVATRILADYQTSPEFDDLLTRIPAAFFKSIGYGAVAFLLGGALAGTGLAEADDIQARWPAARHGGMIMAIHIDTVIPDGSFRKEVDRFVKDIRESWSPMPGYDETLLPGAIEEKNMTRHRVEGIRFGEIEQTAVREMSERLDEPVPWDQ